MDRKFENASVVIDSGQAQILAIHGNSMQFSAAGCRAGKPCWLRSRALNRRLRQLQGHQLVRRFGTLFLGCINTDFCVQILRSHFFMFFEIYKIFTFSHRSERKISAIFLCKK